MSWGPALAPIYIDWFNNQRLFGPIGYIPSAEAEANYYAAAKDLDMVPVLKPNRLRETWDASKRYSIGSQTPGLAFAADGSSTLPIQHDSPGPAKETNWLPAPAGAFDIYLRTYVPQKALLAGIYKLPVERQAPAKR